MLKNHREGLFPRFFLICLMVWRSFRLCASYLRKDVGTAQFFFATGSDNSREIDVFPDNVSSHSSVSMHDVSLHDGQSSASGGVLHFLFLVNDSVAHSDVWGDFFRTAPPNSWRVWVHCKHEALCATSRLFEDVPDAQMVPAVATEYCTDLVTGMVQLLRVSLAHSDVGVAEKFAFVGDTTLPVKPFPVVYGALMARPEESDFCVHPTDRWRSTVVNGTTFSMVKHSQWVVLGRNHAEVFVRQWVPVDHGNWQVPIKAGGLLKGESGTSILHWKFKGDWHSGVCTDEWAVFTTLFGALSPGTAAAVLLPGLGVLRSNSTEAQGRCRTFVLPDSHRNFLGALAEPILEAAEGDPQQVRSRGHEGDPAKGTHPMSFMSAGSATLNALRSSPFLFARKFPVDSQIPLFSTIVLA